jgi:tellurite methyltransferase
MPSTKHRLPARDDRAYWNQRYSERSHEAREPDPFLVEAFGEFVAPAFPDGGRALDVASGTGRHALWLASRGWDITLVDVSDVGLARAKAEWDRTAKAPGRGTLTTRRRIEFIAADLEGPKAFRPQRRSYDLVLVFFYLQRSLFPALKAALKPGGILIYKTYTLEHRKFGRGPTHPMYFLKPNELLGAFDSMHILHYRELSKDRGVAELVARNV